MVDWGACGTGPLVYDVASAVVYAGGAGAAGELVDGYTAAAPVIKRPAAIAAKIAALRTPTYIRDTRPVTSRSGHVMTFVC